VIGVAFVGALRDFVRPSRIVTWGLIGLAVGLIGHFWVGFQKGQPIATYGMVTEVLVFRVMALASAIFSMQVLASEIEQKTVVYLLTRSIDRPSLLVGRSLASFVAVLGASLATWFAAGIGVLGPRAFQTGAFWWDAVVILLGVLAYGSLFILVSLILNKAMIYCLLFAFGWETFVPNMPGDLYYLSIFPYLKSISGHIEVKKETTDIMDAVQGALTTQGVSAGASWAVLGAMMVVFTWLGIVWFSRSEYTPREDSE
jgi:ABC-type transport system involved in multi-copper enzyme maturation permease subunit